MESIWKLPVTVATLIPTDSPATASRALIKNVVLFNFSVTIQGGIKTSVQVQGVPFSF